MNRGYSPKGGTRVPHNPPNQGSSGWRNADRLEQGEIGQVARLQGVLLAIHYAMQKMSFDDSRASLEGVCSEVIGLCEGALGGKSMTKPRDWEGAVKAAMLVAKQATPPFRYQVIDELIPTQPVALALTRWAAWLCADAIGGNLKPPARMIVLDMDGNKVERRSEDYPAAMPVPHRTSA